MKQLGNRCKLTLWWVPEHFGIRDNEMADRLAKLGSRAGVINSHFMIGANRRTVGNNFEEWIDR